MGRQKIITFSNLKQRTTNKRLTKVAVQCSANSFVINQNVLHNILRSYIKDGEIATFAKQQNVSTATKITCMKIGLIILLQFLSNFIFAQNVIEVKEEKASIAFYKDLGKNLSSYNLDSIQNSDKKTIRIWQGQSVLTFGSSTEYLQKFTNLKNHLDYFYKKKYFLN